jgi:hypothetical protein
MRWSMPFYVPTVTPDMLFYGLFNLKICLETLTGKLESRTVSK